MEKFRSHDSFHQNSLSYLGQIGFGMQNVICHKIEMFPLAMLSTFFNIYTYITMDITLESLNLSTWQCQYSDKATVISAIYALSSYCDSVGEAFSNIQHQNIIVLAILNKKWITIHFVLIAHCMHDELENRFVCVSRWSRLITNIFSINFGCCGNNVSIRIDRRHT